MAPPKSHNLVQLAEKIDCPLSSEEKIQLRELSSFAEFARYGDETWLDAEATKENVEYWFDISNHFLSKLLP